MEGREVVGPWRVTGEMVADRLTVLLKPFVPVTVIVNVAVDPFLTVWEDGLSVIVKSGSGVILNDTITECERLPLFP